MKVYVLMAQDVYTEYSYSFAVYQDKEMAENARDKLNRVLGYIYWIEEHGLIQGPSKELD